MWSPKRVNLIKYSTMIIVSLFIFLTLFAGFTIYGANVGHFVVKTDEGNSLSLSEREDFSDMTDYLTTEGVSELKDATLSSIPSSITAGLGNKNDPGLRYFAYSFYLLNTSDKDLDYYMDLRITEQHKNVDESLRIWIISDGFSKIFKKAEKNAEAETALYQTINKHYGSSYECQNFISETEICSERFNTFRTKDVKKYTVVVWIEGYDADTTNNIKGGSVKFSLDFIKI